MGRHKKEEPKRGPGRPRKPAPKIDHRGGAREGAGRKAYLKPEERKVNIGLCVSPLNKARCDELRKKGISLSREFEKVIEKLAAVLCDE